MHPPKRSRLLVVRVLAVTATAICSAALAGTAPAAPSEAVRDGGQPTISPAPGTPDASPSTQISILGAPPRSIESVAVTGSLSGAHAGRLRSYSGGRGASFVLRDPLTQGERVSVRIRIAGRRPIAFSFTVAHLAPIQPVLDLTAEQPAKLDHFASLPALLPPKIMLRRSAAGSAGDIFLTPLPSPIVHPESQNELSITPVGPGGPMIVDGRGRLVWFDQLEPPDVAANFRPQRFDGHEVLTWWQGGVTPSAFGIGEDVIASTSYRTIRIIHAGNGYAVDLHEFVLTPSGDALFTVYSPVLVHLAGTPAGKLSPLLDSIVQEVDIRTGLVVWEWHALGHIPLADSDASPATSADYDAYHLNSIQPLPGDRLLLSARDTSAVYLIDQRTGRIIWTLGGKASSFRMGRGARFYFQHDVQLLPGDRVSLFDDEGGPPFHAASSRGLILALNLRGHTARVIHQYRRPGAGTLAESEGSVQLIAGGDVFVGFGSERFFSQFTAAGRLVLDGSLPVDDGSYRVFRYPWSATPTGRPTVGAHRVSPGRVIVYASWNGATTVARWQVLAGREGRLVPLERVPDRGFETSIVVRGIASSFAVRALSARGRVLATSLPVSAP